MSFNFSPINNLSNLLFYCSSFRWFLIAYIFLLLHDLDIKSAPNLCARYLSKKDLAILSFEV